MTHILAHHPDISTIPGHSPSIPGDQPPALPAPTRKRKAKADGERENAGPEPRRLRRSHEACARCRSKKIKCDSKHPRCTSCTNANTPCHQEDRHRQTLTPRGHTEKLERKLAQCEMLLKRRIEGFDVENLDNILISEGMDPNVPPPSSHPGFSPFSHPLGLYEYPFLLVFLLFFSCNPMYQGFDLVGEVQYSENSPVPHPPPPQPGGPPGGSPVYSVPNGNPYAQVYVPHLHPQFQPAHLQPQLQQHASASHVLPVNSQSNPPPSTVSENIKGQDPQSNDMSSTSALAKNFGVSPIIVNDLKLGANAMDREDLAVGALHSGRDREVTIDSLPRQPMNWIRVSVRRGSVIATSSQIFPSINVWLPRDREMVNRIVDIYFSRLNYHRPVFPQEEFNSSISALYAGTISHDPGFICSVYIILALGTLSEMNHRACSLDGQEGRQMPRIAKNLMPEDWPDHEEFFDRALAVKPDLRVTISSLQALILLQWYLYTERQGRSLWRLVGSLVRLAVELGLHHDPFVQGKTFTTLECEQRVRLWAIVMVHDRGTSLLLGRPLAIPPEDSNTPSPDRESTDFSEHFAYSSPIADIQADIINSLYRPTKISADIIWKHATRIIKLIGEFQQSLPHTYKTYFSGTARWTDEERRQLVSEITEAQGLTLLKLGIARILLLRVVFSAKELSYERRSKALEDAIITSHNIIIVHNEMIRFPDIAFFVSPIPLHIAAMVILFGHMSECKMLSRQQALEDVWMALDMLPRFRWRWDRKDLNGAHPLIAKVAEKVFNAPLHQAGPTPRPMLIPGLDWTKPEPTTPNSPIVATPATTTASINSDNRPKIKVQETLAEIAPHWFYPHEQPPIDAEQIHRGVPGPSQASVPYAPLSTLGCAPSQESYVQEEKDVPLVVNQQHHMEMWMTMIDQQGIGPFMHSQT